MEVVQAKVDELLLDLSNECVLHVAQKSDRYLVYDYQDRAPIKVFVENHGTQGEITPSCCKFRLGRVRFARHMQAERAAAASMAEVTPGDIH